MWALDFGTYRLRSFCMFRINIITVNAGMMLDDPSALTAAQILPKDASAGILYHESVATTETCREFESKAVHDPSTSPSKPPAPKPLQTIEFWPTKTAQSQPAASVGPRKPGRLGKCAGLGVQGLVV